VQVRVYQVIELLLHSLDSHPPACLQTHTVLGTPRERGTCTTTATLQSRFTRPCQRGHRSSRGHVSSPWNLRTGLRLSTTLTTLCPTGCSATSDTREHINHSINHSAHLLHAVPDSVWQCDTYKQTKWTITSITLFDSSTRVTGLPQPPTSTNAT
jgi:hypothetical protein